MFIRLFLMLSVPCLDNANVTPVFNTQRAQSLMPLNGINVERRTGDWILRIMQIILTYLSKYYCSFIQHINYHQHLPETDILRKKKKTWFILDSTRLDLIKCNRVLYLAINTLIGVDDGHHVIKDSWFFLLRDRINVDGVDVSYFDMAKLLTSRKMCLQFNDAQVLDHFWVMDTNFAKESLLAIKRLVPWAMPLTFLNLISGSCGGTSRAVSGRQLSVFSFFFLCCSSSVIFDAWDERARERV